MKKKYRLGASLTAAAMLCMGLSAVWTVPAAAEAAPADAAPREISAADRAQVTTSPYYPEYDPFANVETDQYGNEYPPGTNALCEVRLEIKEYPQQVFAVGEEFNTNGLKVFMIAQYTHNQKDYDVTPVLNIRTDYDADTPGTYTVWLSSDYVDGEVYAEDEISYEVTVDSTVTTAPYEGDDIVTGGIETTCTTAAAAPRIAAGEATVRVGERGHIYYPIDTSSLGTLQSISQEPRGIVQNLEYSSYSGSMRLDFTGKAVGTTKVTLFMSNGSGYEFIITVLPEDTPVETTETTETWDTTTTTTLSLPSGGSTFNLDALWVGIGESKKIYLQEDDGETEVLRIVSSQDGILENVGFEYSEGNVYMYFTCAASGETTVTAALSDGNVYVQTVYVSPVTNYIYVEANVDAEVTCPVTMPGNVRIVQYDFNYNDANVKVSDIENYGTMFNFHLIAANPGKSVMRIVFSNSNFVMLHITAVSTDPEWTEPVVTTTEWRHEYSFYTPWDTENDISVLLAPADFIETYEITGVPVELRDQTHEGDRLTLTFYGETAGEAQYIAHTHMGMTLVIYITIGDGFTHVYDETEDIRTTTTTRPVDAFPTESEVWAYVGGEVTCPIQVRQGVTVETYALSDNSAAVEVTNVEDYGTMFNFHIEANDLGTATLTITLSDSSVVVLHITAAECFTTWTTTQLTTTSYNYTGSYHTGTHPSVSSSTPATWNGDVTTVAQNTTLYAGETDLLLVTFPNDGLGGCVNTNVSTEVRVDFGDVTARAAGIHYGADGDPYLAVEVIAPENPTEGEACVCVGLGNTYNYYFYSIVNGTRPAVTTEWRHEYSFYTPWDSESDTSLLLEPADYIEDYELTGVPVELRNMTMEGDRLTLTFYGETAGEAQFIAHTHMGMTLVINITIGDGFTHVYDETDVVTEMTTADGFGTGTYPTAVTALHVGETVTQVFTLPTDAVLEYDADGSLVSPTVPRVFSEFGLANVSVSDVLTNEFGPYFVITIEGTKQGTDRIEIDSADYPDLYLLVLPETVEDDPYAYPTADICTGNRLTAVAAPEYAYDAGYWNAAFLNKLLGTDLIEDVEIGKTDEDGCRTLTITLWTGDKDHMAMIAEQLYQTGAFGAIGVTDAEPYLPVITTTTTELEPDCVTTETTTTASSAVSSSAEGGSDLPQTGNNDPTALVLGLLAGLLTLGGAAVLVRRKEEA